MKRLTVAKTKKKISKLSKSLNELNDQLKSIGTTYVRGKAVSAMDNNYILYNIAMFKSMIIEVVDLYPEGAERTKLMGETVGENIEENMKSVTGIDRNCR